MYVLWVPLNMSCLLMQGLYITNEQSEVIWQRILVRESGRSYSLSGKQINFQDTLEWFIKTINEFSKIRDGCFPYPWVISHKKALGLVMKNLKLWNNQLRVIHYRCNDFQFLKARRGWIFSSKHLSFKLSLFIKDGQKLQSFHSKEWFHLSMPYISNAFSFFFFLNDSGLFHSLMSKLCRSLLF